MSRQNNQLSSRPYARKHQMRNDPDCCSDLWAMRHGRFISQGRSKQNVEQINKLKKNIIELGKNQNTHNKDKQVIKDLGKELVELQAYVKHLEKELDFLISKIYLKSNEQK